MSELDFEKCIALHCAPTILKEKSANLMSLSAINVEDIEGKIKKYNEELNEEGLTFNIICKCEKRFLLLVYRKEMLEACLRKKGALKILKENGYYTDCSLEMLLNQLSYRLKIQEGFPHEIGLFLDYPVEDVDCFIRENGAGGIFCGYWKVYVNEKNARQKFELFDICKEKVSLAMAEGKSIFQLSKMIA